MTEINEKQAALLAQYGVSSPQELPTPAERLAFANIASPAKEPLESTGSTDDGYTSKAKEFLASTGRTVAELDKVDQEILAYWNSDRFRVEDASRPASPPPFALDVNRINAAGLSPDMRMAIEESFNTAKRGLEEKKAGTHPSARRVNDGQVERAMTFVRPYLQTAA